MAIIGLEGLEFFAYHGVYHAERQMGQRFSVDLWLEVNTTLAATSDDLAYTVDYTEVFELVRQRMEKPANLLETLALEIGKLLLDKFPSLLAVKIRVAKYNPPIQGLCTRTYVEEYLSK